MKGYGIKQIDKRKSAGGCFRPSFLFLLLIALGVGAYFLYKYKYEQSPAELISKAFSKDDNTQETADTSGQQDKAAGEGVSEEDVKENVGVVVDGDEPTSLKDLMGDGKESKSKVTTLSPKARKEVEALYEKAVKEFRNKDFVKTRNYCLEILAKGLGEDQPLWAETVDMLGKSNIEIFTTGIVVPEKEIYNIQVGDSLDKISKKFNTTIDAIQRSNGLDPASPVIHPGNQFHIYKGDWHIKVSKGHYRLYLYDGDKLFKVYNIAIGKQNRTPAGTFEIVEKVRQPDWVYRGKRYPYGSKENVLGTRWMRMKPTGNTNRLLRGYGIHGTWEPDSIGKQASNGCIRMVNNDVEELFEIIPKYRKADGSHVDVIITED
jgi:LysM repeat protein